MGLSQVTNILVLKIIALAMNMSDICNTHIHAVVIKSIYSVDIKCIIYNYIKAYIYRRIDAFLSNIYLNSIHIDRCLKISIHKSFICISHATEEMDNCFTYSNT